MTQGTILRLSIIVLAVLCFVSTLAFAQAPSDSIRITFRSFSAPSTTVFVPGQFNNWGPNSSGVITAGAASQMTYDAGWDGWLKTYTFKIHDPADTRRTLGDSVFQYKFNRGGGSSGWISDPLNPERNASDNENSILRLSRLFWFEVNFVTTSTSIMAVQAGLPHANGDTIVSIVARTGPNLNALTETDVTLQYDESLRLADFLLPEGVAKNDFVILVAKNNRGDSAVYTRIGYAYVTLPMPAYVKHGVTLPSAASQDSVSFRLRVQKDYVLLRLAPLGQNPALATPILMRKAADPSNWWINLKLAPGTYEYVFEFPDSRQIYDPWGKYNGTSGSRFTVGPEGLTADDYVWQNTSWVRPPLNKVVLYELNLAEAVGGWFNRTGNQPKNFKDLIALLPYFDSLGINAIELMPVNDYGNVGPSGFSWGYDLNTQFALEPALGTPRDFKTLVDSAHGRGIAIVIDAVYNHLNETGPLWNLVPDPSQNPYFHDFGRANKNEDQSLRFFRDLDHWTHQTQEYVLAAMKMWIDDYRVDGFRLDFTRGIGWDLANTNVGILGWANKISTQYDGKVYLMAEHLPESPTLIRTTGLTSGWHDSFRDKVFDEARFQNVTMSDLENLVVDLGAFPSPDVPNNFSRYGDRTEPINMTVNHDEQSLIFELTTWQGVSMANAIKRDKLYATFMFTSLGVPLLWQGMEHAESRGWSSDNLKLTYRPVQWNLRATAAGQAHFRHYQSLIFQRLNNPALYQGELQKLFKYNGQRSMVWGFRDTASSAKVMVVANFSGADQILRNIPWLAAGTWYDIFDQSQFQATATTVDSMVIPAFTARVFSNKSNDMLLDVAAPNSGLPAAYELEQNYPNPFNPSTVIRFSLKERVHASLVVYDILGREVATLVNGELSPGEHQVPFLASGLASGVYFYKLTTPAFTAMQKMVLAR